MSTPTAEPASGTVGSSDPPPAAGRDPEPDLARRGQHGRLFVRAERIAARTRLAEVEQQPPLQVLRAHYLETALPDLAAVTVASPAGGVLQGDRLETTIRVGPGARLTVGTQSSTRVYRAPDAWASIATTLDVAPGAYLEFLPDPYIPYDGSRLRTTATCLVAEEGTLLYSEALVGGRLARGERFGLDRFESLIEIRRPGGDLITRDAVSLGAEPPVGSLGRLGAHLAFGTLYVVHRGFAPAVLRAAAEIESGSGRGLTIGASELPDAAGAWLRVLGPDAGSVASVLRVASAAVRRELLGVAPGADRRP